MLQFNLMPKSARQPQRLWRWVWVAGLLWSVVLMFWGGAQVLALRQQETELLRFQQAQAQIQRIPSVHEAWQQAPGYSLVEVHLFWSLLAPLTPDAVTLQRVEWQSDGSVRISGLAQHSDALVALLAALSAHPHWAASEWRSTEQEQGLYFALTTYWEPL